ncbi:unnamed protein product [Prorocentrum cordatum]|uniref:FH2 domain-containing protein n=1 Tax=Prorocentrum cordatum TaxID=2364126 RepID=A0ABN9TPQ1_9DINO|nr:unnamed protein product [Polarella glacialis]
MPCTDLRLCKRVCLEHGYGGFVVKSGAAFFQKRARSALLGHARCAAAPSLGCGAAGPSAVPTLLVAPAPSAGSSREEEHREWIEAMERTVVDLRGLAEQCRFERDRASAEGDAAAAERAGAQLGRLNRQQARVASALWAAQGGHPDTTAFCCESLSLLLGAAAGVAHEDAAAGAAARAWGVGPGDGGGADGASGTSAAAVATRGSSPRQLSAGARPDHPQADGASSSGAAAPAARAPSPCRQSADSRLPEGLQAQRLDAAGPAAMAMEPASAGGGKGPGRGPGRGPGKGGRSPPPAPRGAKGGKRGRTPLGRRFHWQGLSADRLRGTVFERDATVAAAGAPERALNLAAVERLFSDPQMEDVSRPSGGDNEVRVLSASRAQHVYIVMHRVLGPSATVADVEQLARGLEQLSLADGSSVPPQDAESLELLGTALPTAEEAAELEGLEGVLEARLRRVERLLMPLVRVPRADVRLRVLQLAMQAPSMQAYLRARAGRLAEVARALRGSDALRRLLRAVARLGSWINSSDPGAQGGFALSSALGKLRYFRALRGDRSVSLLHVAVLAAAGGDAEAAGALGGQLGRELQGLREASREDVGELGQAVADFASEAEWLKNESERHGGPGDGGYTTEARRRLVRMREEELAPRVAELQSTWGEAKAELRAALTFFAEPQEPAPGDGIDAGAAERLLRTVDAFRCDLQRAASEVCSQPERFAAVCAGSAARALS